jgi:hypothetical protein
MNSSSHEATKSIQQQLQEGIDECDSSILRLEITNTHLRMDIDRIKRQIKEDLKALPTRREATPEPEILIRSGPSVV